LKEKQKAEQAKLKLEEAQEEQLKA